MSPDAVFMLTCFVAVLLLVAGTLFYFRTPKNKKIELDALEEEIMDTQIIINLLKNSQTTKEDLYYLVDLFFKNYSQLHPTNQQKKDLLKAVCLHHQTNTHIILRTQEGLTQLNPSLKQQLNRIVEIRAGLY